MASTSHHDRSTRPSPSGGAGRIPWLEVSGRRAARRVILTAVLLLPVYALVYHYLSPGDGWEWSLWVFGEGLLLGVLALERWDDREGRWFWLSWRLGHYVIVLWFGVLAATNRFSPLYTNGLIWMAAVASVTFNVEPRRLREQGYFMGWIVGVAAAGMWLVDDPITPPLDLLTGVGGLVLIVLPILGWRLALARRERVFASLFENAGSGVLVWRDGAIVACNARVEELFDRSSEELVGRGPEVFADPEDCETGRFAAKLEEVCGRPGGEQTLQFETRFEDGAGTRRWAQVILSEIELEDAPVVQALVWEITDRKAYEAELERARADAERAQSLSSRILANLSHEIRGPLATIRGYAELLREEVGAEKQNLVAPIYERSRRLLDQVGELLRLARVEAGTRGLERERVAVVPALRDVLGDRIREAERKGLRIEISARDDLLEATVDPEALRQIVRNLVHNAFKFTEEGRVTVRVERGEEGGLLLTVADEGIGIAEDEMETVFEPFRQLEASGAKPEGLGLGLSIVRRLVELHGGEIAIESEPGVGTKVRVFLPEGTSAPAPEQLAAR